MSFLTQELIESIVDEINDLTEIASPSLVAWTFVASGKLVEDNDRATVRRAVFTVTGPSVEASAAFTYGSAVVRVDPYTGYPYPSAYGSTGPTGQRGYGDTRNARKARFRRGGCKSGGVPAEDRDTTQASRARFERDFTPRSGCGQDIRSRMHTG
ncbi:hypothetical protein B0H17DRAFT_1140595 [Mycena rosella]|uniref:Uncharacterized protein n=1 Tax=Mycena rosella TaxID=1033263 RepID=A0AAD7D1V4_MYCRO|nr:hypothetical protein B0H17DRAFT_1140595 [Mycena rosella]